LSTRRSIRKCDVGACRVEAVEDEAVKLILSHVDVKRAWSIVRLGVIQASAFPVACVERHARGGNSTHFSTHAANSINRFESVNAATIPALVINAVCGDQ